MKTLQELKACMEARGMTGFFRVAGPQARNAVLLRPQVREEDGIPLGASKLGGDPDLPAELPWPRREGSDLPLSFLGQLNLAEVHPWDQAGELPERGMLYFFYDCSEDGMPWGFDPEDRDGHRVCFYDGNAPLERRTPPEDLEQDGNGLLFDSAALSFDSEIELPNPESDVLDLSGISEEEMDRYWDYVEETEDDAGSKLLGHSDNIQGGMEHECAAAAGGIYMGGGPACEQAARDSGAEREALKWKLLMQLDSHDDLGMMWGDLGKLYIWIREEDLARRDFGRTWLILQCT